MEAANNNNNFSNVTKAEVRTAIHDLYHYMLQMDPTDPEYEECTQNMADLQNLLLTSL